jgi:hypothetical protein
MHLYVALNEACCHDLPCEGDPADHEIVAIGPSLGYYIFLLVGNGADLRDNSFM